MLFIYVIGCNKCISSEVYYEKSFNDILYINIRSHYFNITSLLFASISWINKNVNYDYLIKWDDDIIVNLPLLYIFINIQNRIIHYSGYVYNRTNICRNKNKICYIPYIIYKYSYIPSFSASGFLILSSYSTEIVSKYYNIYRKNIIRDDQLIGILLNILSIFPVNINKYYIRINASKKEGNIKNFLAYHTNNCSELFDFYLYIKTS